MNGVPKNNIKELRLKRGILQQDLAKMVGVSKWWMSDVECGRFTPSTKLVLRIAKVLNVKLDDIFFD